VGKGDPGIGWAQMLDELNATGYTGTELGDYGYMPTEPAELRAELAARGLTLLGAYAGVDLRRKGAAAAERPRLERLTRLLAEAEPGPRRPLLVLADQDHDAAVRSLQAGRITPDLGLSSAEWSTVAANVTDIARIALDAAGLATVFHPHCGSYVETPDEIERLLEATDPALLGLVFDTGHYVYGSGAPDPDGLTAARGLERFWERVKYVHLKDCDQRVAERARAEEWDYVRAVRGGLYSELGRGGIDFAAVVEVLRVNGYADWVTVEQDVLPGMGTPKESARRNREFLRELGL
jgi:inosose dehydratase